MSFWISGRKGVSFVSPNANSEKVSAWFRLMEVLLRPPLAIATKPHWTGLDNIPAQGGAILVCNHISLADPLVIARFVYERRLPHFLAKDSLFTVPVMGYLLNKVGQIPVRRRSVDAAKSLELATEAIKKGATVIIYPEGTRTQDPQLWPMQGKTGAARLALLTGAPIVPIAQWGAHNIHHRFTGKLRLWQVPIQVSAGVPVDFSAFVDRPITNTLLREATEIIMRRLRNDVAVLRSEPAPTGLLYTPAEAQHSTGDSSVTP